MAGDWIKMRGELWTHPKFLSLCDALVHSDGMLAYISNGSNETVTLRALHDVTMSALMRVWCSVSAHAKVETSDAICSPIQLSGIDEISGVGGFGKAMECVGWIRVRDSNTLVFPHFCEHNSPACLRPPVKSGAERQRLFRERARSHKSKRKERNETVTRCNGREEKRRDDDHLDDDHQAAANSKALNLEAVTRWNAIATKYGRPKIQALTETRRKALQARLAERPGLGDLLDAEAVLMGAWARSQAFLTFDWIVSPSNLQKFLDGNYRDRGDGVPDAAAKLGRRSSWNDPHKFDFEDEKKET
jgi:hypothetical protein